jgi:hypothetical protein
MTRTQRAAVIVLTLVNILVFGILAVIAVGQFNDWRMQTAAVQATAVAVEPLAAAPRVTLAPTATSTAATATPPPARPTPTDTLVVTSALVLSTPPAGLDAGWKYYENPGQGFGLGLPPSWAQLDLAPTAFQNALDSLEQKNPDLASVLGSEGNPLLASGFKFFGFDAAAVSAQRGFVTNVNVMVEPLPFPVPLDTYVQLSLAQLDQLTNVQKPITHTRVKLGANEAEEMRYHLQLTNAQGATLTTSTLQYALIGNQRGYVITLTTAADQEQDYATTFDQIAQSFRWVP